MNSPAVRFPAPRVVPLAILNRKVSNRLSTVQVLRSGIEKCVIYRWIKNSFKTKEGLPESNISGRRSEICLDWRTIDSTTERLCSTVGLHCNVQSPLSCLSSTWIHVEGEPVHKTPADISCPRNCAALADFPRLGRDYAEYSFFAGDIGWLCSCCSKDCKICD